MVIRDFDSNKVSKSVKFCRSKNRFIPFGSHVHGRLIWVKICTFYKDESTHLRDLIKQTHKLEIGGLVKITNYEFIQRTTCISQGFWPPLKPKIKSVFTTLSLDCFIR